jgi:hypothetical protein
MSYSEFQIEDFKLHIFRFEEYPVVSELHLYWNDLLIHIEKYNPEEYVDKIWKKPHDLVKKLLKAENTRVSCRYNYDGLHEKDSRAIYRYNER